MAEILLITAIFAIIRFHDTLSPLVMVIFISIGIFSGIMLMLAIDFAVGVTTSSVKISQLASKSGLFFNRANVAFLRSCAPFQWKIGESFTLNEDTFIRIMDTVVIEGVMSLLLM